MSGVDKRCVFAATATSPEGPYSNAGGDGMVTCGAYAAQWFRGEGGAPYIVTKRTAEGIGFHKMNDNLVELGSGNWTDVALTKNRPWEQDGPLEGPAFLQLQSGYWVLFYTVGDWHTDHYAEGYVVCGNGNIPNTCPTKPSDNKLVSSYGKSFSLGAGMGYFENNSSNNVNLVVAGFFGSTPCGNDCFGPQKYQNRYARIFRLNNTGATPPTTSKSAHRRSSSR